MFHIMIAVNVLYVLAELIFNIVLLKVVSAEVSLNDIQEVETLGRGLAAFGFTFIILKLFQGYRARYQEKNCYYVVCYRSYLSSFLYRARKVY